jgi:sortase A
VLTVGYEALLGYLSWRESVSPSVSRMLVLKDGRRIPLVQPSPAADCGRRNADCGANIQQSVFSPDQNLLRDQPSGLDQARLQNPKSAKVLPPLRIEISRIGVDRPVVLADNDQMPRFGGVGWLMGSAYPGAPGNLVLFGHLDGRYATFGRLKELQPGDEFRVLTGAQAFRYRVHALDQVTPDDVSVLVPTTTPTATLITCSGAWDPLVKMYDHRLVITADYLDAELLATDSGR